MNIQKPKVGSPCNGCGFCCQREACHLSKQYLNSTAAPCVALEYRDGRSWCGLVREPSKYMGLERDWADAHISSLLAHALGLGMGCDADDERATDASPTAGHGLRSATK